MKRKKLSKLIKSSISDAIKSENIRKDKKIRKFESKAKYVSSNNDILFSECDEDTKSKTRNLIYRIVEFREELRINSNPKTITIQIESLDSITKTSKSHGSKSNKSSSYIDDYDLSFEIIKNVGYISTIYGKRIGFIDKDLYNDVISEIKKAYERISNSNFNDLYSKIMIETGLARDSNLDDLLKSSEKS